CTVTQKTDAESRRLIRKAAKENPKSKIVITGCYTELDSDEIEKVANNLLIVKNSEKNKILQYLMSNMWHLNTNTVPVTPIKKVPVTFIRSFEGRTRAFVKIQDGCDNFCSYCKVPLVRGRSRSRRSEEIIQEISGLVSDGYKEIVLCGICLGDWGRDLGFRLSWLLDEIENNVKGEFRIRLSSIEPWYVSSDLLEKIAASNRICRHLHIPMQSGDDEVLKRMNRNFKTRDFLKLIDRLRSLIPEAAFTTDILIGFPGETEQQFHNTLRMTQLTRPSRVHIFPFSMRKGTRASRFDRESVSEKIIKKRIEELKSLTDKLAIEYRNQFIGKPVTVLIETERDKKTGLLSGFTDTYIKVAFLGPDKLKVQFVRLTLTNSNSYDILAPHLEGADKLDRVFSKDKLDGSLSCNSFNQK
ncbi:MAG: tRNA (N(6)-L-threonylcarbamoyladenosine(37)-C(2))-methylthiotransferase MtaB, partial [Candidatus Omnitrophica bacterium]|nr:tRNA (N(6)-L-threonylcarbamoyladenosine(37)-C(2))-methylthiotransferase MtaB [Candidatus Omnitrophota bacterium]